MSRVVPYLDESPLAADVLSHARITFTDLDGTLLGLGGSVLIDATGAPALTTVNAIVDVNRAGLDVVVCTGRNRIQTGEVSRILGWDSFIAELGCIVMYDRRKPAQYLLGEWPAGVLLADETPHQAMTRYGALRVLTETFPGKIEEHEPWHTDREVTHVLRGSIDRTIAQEALDTLEVPIAIIDNGIIHPPRHTLVDVDEIHVYHLVPRGTSKERAIRVLLERRGITPADAVAIGDSATDVEMMGATALGVLVCNALRDPKVLAATEGLDTIVATRGERGDGWAEFAHAWLAAMRLSSPTPRARRA
ncbi:MAG: HAD-IIB family hydrolase [Actinomycetia bacterium]|nr:HAD-IIB family hydrolase [Actinomycetes bacterium]